MYYSTCHSPWDHKTFGLWSLVGTFLDTHSTYPVSVEIGFWVVVIFLCCSIKLAGWRLIYLMWVFINLHHCADFHPFCAICVLHLHFL